MLGDSFSEGGSLLWLSRSFLVCPFIAPVGQRLHRMPSCCLETITLVIYLPILNSHYLMDASEAFENVRLLLNRRGADNKFVHLNINPQECMEPELQDFTVHLIQIIVFACPVSDK